MTTFSKISIFITFAFLVPLKIFSQKLPEGYIEQYSEKCLNNTFFNSFLPEEMSDWKFIQAAKGNILSISSEDSIPIKLFPETKGIIRNLIFGDYIVEFEFKLSQKVTGTEGFCFIGPVKSIKTYYAFLFSSDSVSFSFINNGTRMIVEKQPAHKISADWNKVRIERYILNRSSTIIINGDYSHKIVFKDPNLVMGYVGFGSHDASCFLRNIKIWAPTSIDTTFKWR
jgi:hypothetical protein